MKTAQFEDLIGKILTEIISEKERIEFICDNGDRYLMYHSQDCCERVSVEDIIGDLNDLLNTPILKATNDFSNDIPEDVEAAEYIEESQTWTFYNISTIKGHVTIRWHGSSNGYYSESVDFVKYEKL